MIITLLFDVLSKCKDPLDVGDKINSMKFDECRIQTVFLNSIFVRLAGNFLEIGN